MRHKTNLLFIFYAKSKARFYAMWFILEFISVYKTLTKSQKTVFQKLVCDRLTSYRSPLLTKHIKDRSNTPTIIPFAHLKDEGTIWLQRRCLSVITGEAGRDRANEPITWSIPSIISQRCDGEWLTPNCFSPAVVRPGRERARVTAHKARSHPSVQASTSSSTVRLVHRLPLWPIWSRTHTYTHTHLEKKKIKKNVQLIKLIGP